MGRLTAEDRADLAALLRRANCPAVEIQVKLEALEQAGSSFDGRSQRRAASARIGEVVSQLTELVQTAHEARRTGAAFLPCNILEEVFAALVGSYPFSNVDLAAVTVETLENPGRYAGSYRTAVVDAPVEPHVVNAALRPRSEAHLVAIRSVPFPFEAARKYFLEGLAEPKADHLRRRLADFIVGMSDVAPAFLEQVRDRVHRATRDPERQNPARRTLYDWAEPWPEARLVWDVLEATLQPAAERPDPAVQVIIVEIIDLLAGPTAEAIRSDIISAMVTIWVATSQHRIVAARLSSMLDGVPGLAETPRQRRRLGFWAACHGIIRHSAAELLRRGCMGDHHHVGQVGLGPEVFDPKLGSPGRRTSGAPKARATGLPVPTLDLSAAASAGSNCQFLRNVASACRPWLTPYRTSCDGT